MRNIKVNQESDCVYCNLVAMLGGDMTWIFWRPYVEKEVGTTLATIINSECNAD